nr:immunoglobulin light chain junction region [Homo sapiens]MCH27978.1 immunoglobulin light chain junction region [Homo sapiens]
DYYCQVWDSST